MGAKLTLGPVFFHWDPDRWRDFYFRIADEAPLDAVCVGEVVCSKRMPFLEPVVPDVLDRLAAAGKQVVLSSLALIMSEREQDLVRDLCATDGYLLEANDVTAVSFLSGRPHVVGPLVNVYNEGTLGWLADRGALRVSLPGELPGASIRTLAADPPCDLEVQVFGRLPLAISARCYHARSRNRSKDSCQYVCAEDPDGMDLDTLDGEPFLAVNGTQTLSHTYVNLAAEVPDLLKMGIGSLRLSPQALDMVAVSACFRDLADGRIGTEEALLRLDDLTDGQPTSNGYFHGVEGARQVAGPDLALS